MHNMCGQRAGGGGSVNAAPNLGMGMNEFSQDTLFLGSFFFTIIYQSQITHVEKN